MVAEGKKYRHVKGIIHCHTDLSYDCSVSLSILCSALQSEGFSFVAITDHIKGVTVEHFQDFVVACREISTNKFVAIPGLEIRLSDGSEVAAVGVSDFIHATEMQDVVDQIHQQGGYAIWVHPHKNGRSNLTSCCCDAIEILNGKVDGIVAPSFSLFFQTRRLQSSGRKVHSIFGADLHELQVVKTVWTECKVASLSMDEILHALKEGQYVNHVARISVNSNGNISVFTFFLFVLIRLAYLAWNKILEAMPDKIHKITVRSSRKIVSFFKLSS